MAANGYVKENTDEAIAFVIIDENDKPDIQVNNTFLTNKEVKAANDPIMVYKNNRKVLLVKN